MHFYTQFMAYSILSIDDDVSVRKSLFYIFKDQYPFFEAQNSDEAFALLKQQEIDLIFLDLNFPNEDGLDILKKLLAVQPIKYQAVRLNR